ncbi:uncharacterized protein [Atheta coriaria]|uniref:uncharacterized protein n=1 Tax=Dalotia coriaria TaxID=877792 RepID=UPI0031F3AB87
MEVMEDGNLMDKVLILIQRDMEYYTEKQSVLQEKICPGVVGGKLDFPRSASFAAVKLVLWWEDEFVAAYKKDSGFLQQQKPTKVSNDEHGAGIVKTSDPAKFTAAITKSSDQLLDHLHVLTQEALDHADLTVLTGTIGAAALIKNCLWCYVQRSEGKQAGLDELQKYQKKYQEMGEALAERLLDLHSRLLSLYILQDSEGLDWENERVFCESERGSYVIQMWWLYMQGTKDDLWNTVPPKMAQRVFAGMLNESLTILTVRYSHAMPSKARSQLYTVDISNLLLCVTKLLPAICNTANEFTGSQLNTQNKMLRDIHSKCQELLTCLLLRGSDLHVLYKMFKRGYDQIGILKPKLPGPSPWITFTMNHLYPELDLTSASSFIELLVLLPQPQPNWAQLLKFICMDECKVGKIFLNAALNELKPKCGVFLCSGDGSCKGVDTTSTFLTMKHYHDIIMAFTFLVLTIGNEREYRQLLLKFITKDATWMKSFDKRHVWSQQRPPWYEAIVQLAKPLMKPISDIVINAVKTGASMYQASSIVLTAFTQLWDCIGPELFIISSMLQDLLSTSVVPMGNSVLLQFLISGLYSELLESSTSNPPSVTIHLEDDKGNKAKDSLFDGTKSTPEEIALAVAEALCGIDEDNKHTEEINALLHEAKRATEDNPMNTEGIRRATHSDNVLEVMTSLLLSSKQGKRSLKILHHFMQNNDEWLMDILQGKSTELKPTLANKKSKGLLHTMFYIGDKPFDELLIGNWTPNWQQLFTVPMGLNAHRVAVQIFARWDLKHGNNQETLVNIQKILKPTSA